ncbi:hypothetical protein ACPCHT_29270 [Nucisporomicrobium flavum]|uniref:AprA-related methyltransferase n=1 Tax=Nucisporomicrobium flavum TaxID=2785915 RepID=UPI003C2FBDBB
MTRTAAEPAAPDRARLRRAAFLAQDGLVLSCILQALDELGVVGPSLRREQSVDELLPGLPAAGFGSLRVVLRTLAAQGWTAHGPGASPAGTVLRWTAEGRAVAAHHRDYRAIGRFLTMFGGTDRDTWSREWPEPARKAFAGLLDRARARWDVDGQADGPDEVVRGHLDGALVMPLLLSDTAVALPDGAAELLDLTGWSGPEAGRYAASFGMSASYLPMFARLADLIRGTTVVRPDGGAEWHVNRALNVNASGAAHGRYFRDTLAVVLDLFNRPDLAAQPRFIADTGCGNGRWLVELYEAVRDRTLRGAFLAEHPLTMVGIDPNQAALDEADRLLTEHGVPAVLLPGDIGAPAGIARELGRHGIDMREGLHIRSFIDHDRPYLGDRRPPEATSAETAAHLDPDGRALAEAAVREDLVAHLRRWAPYVRRHGLLVLEAHSVAPHISQRHLGDMHAVAFEAYHGLSHQYPIDHADWMAACREAGLEPILSEGRCYPTRQPFVAVSLNRLVPVETRTAEGVAEPEPVSADGWALHELVYENGDIRRPRPWCARPTGWLVGRAVRALENRLAVLRPGETIRVLDYGSGTALSVIELLKALRERGFHDRLEDAGVNLELHLADLPGDWFAQGRQLLTGHELVRFHDLRGPDGSFRPLTDVFAPDDVDLVLASMVFHLIPARALDGVVAGLATILRRQGQLLWTSPDTGPSGPSAHLFHDVNRAVRECLLHAPLDDSFPAELRRAIGNVRAVRTAQSDERARRRILSRPHTATELAAAFGRHFTGSVEVANHEIQPDEILATLLVPSNAGEYLPEIADPRLRADLIEALVARVLPRLRGGPGGTASGLSIRWTFGSYAR